jgi:hypothetical protein
MSGEILAGEVTDAERTAVLAKLASGPLETRDIARVVRRGQSESFDVAVPGRVAWDWPSSRWRLP